MMKMKKLFIALAVLLTCLSQCHTVYAAGSIDSQIKSQERDRESLNKKIKQYNELARQKEREGQTILTQLDRLRRDASASRNRMEFLEKENGRIQGSMEELNKSIADARKVLEGLMPRFRSRMLGMYKYSSQERLDAILSIGSAHDALNTAYMLRCFVKQDQDIITELAEQTEKLSLSRSKLEEDRARVQSQTEELRKKRAEFDTTIRQTNALLKDIQGQKKKAADAALCIIDRGLSEASNRYSGKA